MPRSDSSSDYGPPIVIAQRRSHRSSHSERYGRAQSPETIVIENTMLGIPQPRHHRSASTSGKPNPVIYINNDDRGRGYDQLSRSSSRHRHSHRGSSRHRYSDDDELDDRLRRLRIYEKEEALRVAKEEAKRAEELEKAKALLKEAEDKKKDKELREKAVKEWKEEQEKEKEAKKKAEKEYEDKVKNDFLVAGYSLAHIEEILDGRRKKNERIAGNELALEASRPTWIRVHRRYLSIETLEVHGLPWKYDTKDSDYIIIKKWISYDYQEELFEHTRRLKERKLLKGKEKKGDTLILVKKKSKSPGPRRNSWLFT